MKYFWIKAYLEKEYELHITFESITQNAIDFSLQFIKNSSKCYEQKIGK